MQSTLKVEKVFILVDDREKNSNVAFYLKEFGASVNFDRIEVGDFLISSDTCIERKTSRDFASSIIDGRLFNQVKKMKECYRKVIVIIEGNNFNGRISENAYKGAIATLIVNYDVDVINVENEKECARMIYLLAKKEQEDFKKSVYIKKPKKPENISELQQFFLSSLPGVSSVISRRMMEKFGTIKNIVNAEEFEIKNIKGLKKKDAKRIYRIFNERWCE